MDIRNRLIQFLMMIEQKIKVAIADDHPMIIDGVQKMLENSEDIELIYCCKNGLELLDMLEKQVPDVLLLDIQMPVRSGEEVAQVIAKRYAKVKILVLTNFESPAYLSAMLRYGVKGYILKTAEKDLLIEVIRKVYMGEEFIQPSMRDKVDMLTYRKNKITGAKIQLTEREKEMLPLIIKGYTDKEIAETLFLSANTVKNYRNNLLLKMDARNTADLVAKAFRLGLVN